MIAVRMRARALLTSALLTAAVTTVSTLALAAPARAVDENVTVRITELPDEFEPGDRARTVTAVASVNRDGGERRCQKVRWSLLLTVSGVGLDQVRVDRVEQDGSFPVQVRTEGDTARITDVRLDPGQLCPGRTVTAQYRVAVAEDAPEGEVRFEAQAFGRDNELLRSGSATSEVDGEERTPSPSPSPSESPEPEESEEAGDPSEEAAPPPAGSDTGSPDLSATSGEGSTPSLLGPGLIVGAVLVFLGIGLLLRIRLRNRDARHHRRPMPPSFYPTR